MQFQTASRKLLRLNSGRKLTATLQPCTVTANSPQYCKEKLHRLNELETRRHRTLRDELTLWSGLTRFAILETVYGCPSVILACNSGGVSPRDLHFCAKPEKYSPIQI